MLDRWCNGGCFAKKKRQVVKPPFHLFRLLSRVARRVSMQKQFYCTSVKGKVLRHIFVAIIASDRLTQVSRDDPKIKRKVWNKKTRPGCVVDKKQEKVDHRPSYFDFVIKVYDWKIVPLLGLIRTSLATKKQIYKYAPRQRLKTRNNVEFMCCTCSTESCTSRTNC